MERKRLLARQVFSIALTIALSVPAAAQVNGGAHSLYTARLAANAAGQFGGMASSPLIGAAANPTLEAIVTWDRLRRDSYAATSQANFVEYARFLRDHADWPQTITLRRAAEKRVDDTVSAPDRIAFFQQFPPLSALAKLRLAEAQLEIGRGREARTTARDAWDSAGLDERAETQLLALFEKDLRPEDYAARADRLLWSGQTTAAARLLPQLDLDHQRLVLARIGLRGGTPDAASRLAAVPDSLRNDPGLIIDRALYMRQNGDLSSAQALLAGASIKAGSAIDPESWLKTRLEFARLAWRSGNYETAYRIAAQHNTFPENIPVSERPLGERQAYVDSEFLAGWLALRKLGRATDALKSFQNLRAASLTPISQSRGDYWSGRAAETAGKPGEAKRHYTAASEHFDYFYGQLASERLGKPLAIRRLSPPNISADKAAAFRNDSLVRAAFALGEIGDRGRQAIFLRQLADRAETLVDQTLVAGLAVPLGRPDLGVLAGKAARGDGEQALIDFAFPVLELPPSQSGDFSMIHAITRQESQFDQSIVSAANAQGLMQLLPSTAAEQAGKLGLPASTSRLTSDPVYNVTLGSGYFNRLKDNFGGSHVLAVAGYNAGPGNVRKFLTANGDPRTGADVIDWIEAIPLSETKNYVQRVLENAVVYDLLHPQTAIMPNTNRLSAYLGKRTPG
jgi:soluble lytic murein transglycosylase